MSVSRNEPLPAPGGATVGEHPVRAYEARRVARASAASGLRRRELFFAIARFTIFALGVVVLWLSFVLQRAPEGLIALPAFVFVVLVALHVRTVATRERLERAARHYESGLARLRDDWRGRGSTGERFADASHPFASELDLFGSGSLYEVLCTARTAAGQETLAHWMLSPAEPHGIRARQEAVAALRACLDLREDVAAREPARQTSQDAAALVEWGRTAISPVPAPAAVLAWALTVFSVGSIPYLALGGSPLPLAAALLAAGGHAALTHRRVQRATAHVDDVAHELNLVAALVERFRTEPLDGGPGSRVVTALLKRIGTGDDAPARSVARLRRLLDLWDASRNQLFAPIAFLTLWRFHVAVAIERWRRRHGEAIARWIEGSGELDALASLSRHAFERPEDVFPDIEPDGKGLFEAREIGHPLLPPSRCVRNDLTLGVDEQLLIVSGSNMSGKSTLLRTVGTNAVLALMGAPVRAARLRLSRLWIGASLSVDDSLLDGRSRFLTEVSRLKQIMDLAADGRRVLVLVDELLQGTNSHDRRIGAEAVVRGLLGRRAIGLLTTHDLALCEIASVLTPRTGNVHFADTVTDGRMTFDYRLERGVVRKSNALAVMRSVGLDV